MMQFFQVPLIPVIGVPSKPSLLLFPVLFPHLSTFSLRKDMSMPIYLADHWLYFNARCCYVGGWSCFLFLLRGSSSGKNLILPPPLLKELAIYPSCRCIYTRVLNGLVGNHYLEVAGGNCCIKILCSLFAVQDRSRIVRASPAS